MTMLENASLDVCLKFDPKILEITKAFVDDESIVSSDVSDAMKCCFVSSQTLYSQKCLWLHEMCICFLCHFKMTDLVTVRHRCPSSTVVYF